MHNNYQSSFASLTCCIVSPRHAMHIHASRLQLSVFHLVVMTMLSRHGHPHCSSTSGPNYHYVQSIGDGLVVASSADMLFYTAGDVV